MKINKIVDVYRSAGKDAAVKLIAELSPSSSTSSPNIRPNLLSLERCMKKFRKLDKSSGRASIQTELDNFLQEEFVIPKHPGLEQTETERLLESEKKVTELRKGLKRTVAREEYYRSKVVKLEKEKESRETLRDEASQLGKDNREHLASIEWMEALLNDDTDTVTVFDEPSGSYTNECQKCVYELLNHNVSVSKIGPVIATVLGMVGKECEKLPSKSTVLNMNLQRLHLSHQHLGEAFAAESDSCLLTDETSRKGAKYMGYEASDSSGKLWVLGVREMASKSAADTLSVFKEILSDIDLTCQQSQHEPSKLILQHIVATMSDRAATEVKFNTLLSS